MRILTCKYRLSLPILPGLLAMILSGCCECGRPLLWHDRFPLSSQTLPDDTTPEGFPRQMIGYSQFAGEYDRQNRIAVYGHPHYHNEYPTPDYALVPAPNRGSNPHW